MTQFTWLVNTLWTETVAGEQNYVVIASYNVTGVDGTYSASLSNTAQFSTESVSPFIPYDELTNDIVIGWIQQELGENGVNSIEACIQGQIDSQINPPVVPQVTPLPPNFFPTTK
jgi:hypothetical protein